MRRTTKVIKKNKTTNKISLLSKGIKANNSDMDQILIMMEKLLHWAAIIDSSDDAIISKSAEGIITSWNKGAERLYGYTADEIIGKPVSTLMPSQKKNDFPFIMKQLLAGNRVEHYQTQRMTKDGRIIHVSLTVSPIRDSQGNIIGASKIARDITERVLEEERKDTFISTASHELKTPITSQKVLGQYLEHLIDKNGHTELKEYISKINAQTDKLIKLIDDLLDLGRIKGKQLEIENSPFDYNQLVNEIIENTIITTGFNVIKKNAIKEQVCGDRERIGQVLTNLLTNATKYSLNSTKVIVTLKIEGENIVTSIQDFGLGIKPEYHKKIFDRFFRVNNKNRHNLPGMGIGLYIAQMILERHGGKIWVKSTVGKGSTFYFALPILKDK